MSLSHSFNHELRLDCGDEEELSASEPEILSVAELSDVIIVQLGSDRTNYTRVMHDAQWESADSKYLLQRTMTNGQHCYFLNVFPLFAREASKKFKYNHSCEDVSMTHRMEKDTYFAAICSPEEIAVELSSHLQTSAVDQNKKPIISHEENEEFWDIAYHTMADSDTLGRVVERCLAAPINTPVEDMFQPAFDHLTRKYPTMTRKALAKVIDIAMTPYVPQ